MKRIFVRTMVLISALTGLVACSGSSSRTPTPTPASEPAAEPDADLPPSAQRWADMNQPAEFIRFFEGTFDNMGLTVEDSDESFTIHNKGDHFEFSGGIKADAVDFVVPINQNNIEAMLRYVEDDKLDEEEASQIMAVLMVPYTKAIMSHPSTSNGAAVDITGIAKTICSELVNAEGSVLADQRLVYEGSWTVYESINGPCERRLRFNGTQARDYQRAAFTAMKSNTLRSWGEFLTFYRGWRETVTVAVPEPQP
ncbi:MAG: hypothetical protein AAFV53_18370 [Myxococcota bacterium]